MYIGENYFNITILANIYGFTYKFIWYLSIAGQVDRALKETLRRSRLGVDIDPLVYKSQIFLEYLVDNN